MARISWLILLLMVSPSWGQSVKLPSEVKGDPNQFVRVVAETDCGSLQWISLDPGLNLFPVELLKDTKTAVVTAGLPGRYRLLAYGAKANKASEPSVCTIVVGGVAPIPSPPAPPDPPVPPQPVVGFRAVLVNEYGFGTREQLAVMNSPKVSEYLTRKCVGGKEGWRRFDGDVDPKYLPEVWKSLWLAVKPTIKQVPSLVIVVGTEATVFPLPASEADALSLLKKYGGE